MDIVPKVVLLFFGIFFKRLTLQAALRCLSIFVEFAAQFVVPSPRARSLKSWNLVKFRQIRHFCRIRHFSRIRRFRGTLLSSSFAQIFDFGEISPNSSFSLLLAFLDISGFCSMKYFYETLVDMLVHRRFTPSRKFAGTHLYTWVERYTMALFTLGARTLVPEHGHKMRLCSDSWCPKCTYVHIQ